MMKTAADRLKWFLDFAQLDWVSNLDPEQFLFGTPKSIPELKEIKDWEYLKLKDEVIDFIGGDDPSESVRFGIKRELVDIDKNGFPIWASPSNRPFRDEIAEWLTREELAGLSVGSRGYLSYTRDTVTEVSEVSVTLSDPISFRKDVFHVLREPGRKRKIVTKKTETIPFGAPTVSFNIPNATWFIESTPDRLFFIRVGLVLMEEGISQVQECPECHRAFYRVRKQKYCSKTCINRVSRRNWLKSPKNKKKDRLWARQRYERLVKEKTNGNVKVQSRSRKGDKA
jgi:hypothetical protein